jgi:hypothetical protein
MDVSECVKTKSRTPYLNSIWLTTVEKTVRKTKKNTFIVKQAPDTKAE